MSAARKARFGSGRNLWRLLVGSIAAATWLVAAPVSAAPVKIGLIKLPNGGPVYIAADKGYFAAEGLDAQLVYFDGAQPIALGVAGGAIEFAVTGLTAGFYSLAGQGALRIIAGGYNEMPGFPSAAFLVSHRAYANGLTSLKDLPGHSFVIPVAGSPLHYALSLLAEKYEFGLGSVHVIAAQSIPNAVTALAGGQADAALLSTTPAIPALIERGEIERVAWLGDETSMQFGVALTATKITNERRDLVERFLRALRKGARDYHDAFTGADGKRKDGPTAAEVLAIMARYTGQPAGQLEDEIAYVDAEERVDTKDVAHQIAWYKSEGFIKEAVNAEQVIDSRYVIPMNDHR